MLNRLEENSLMKSTKSSRFFLITTILLSVIVTIIILFVNRNEEYKFVFLLPISYIIILLLFSNVFLKPFYNYGFLFYAAQVFIFIRFVITPLSAILSSVERNAGPIPSNIDMNMAFSLMIYELLVIYIAIYIGVAYRKRIQKVGTGRKHTFSTNNFILIFLAIIFFLVLINFPNSIVPEQLLFIDEEFSNDSDFGGTIGIMSLLFKVIAFILLLSIVKKKDNGRSSFLNFSVSFLILVVFLSMFTGTSRWTIIFMGLAGLIVIEKLYPKYKHLLRIGLVSLLGVSFMSITMYKFSWILTDSETPIKDMLIHMTTQFQAYFSGPHTVAQSFNIKEYFPNISLTTFSNDFLGSVPYVSNFIDQSDRINVYFNTYNYKPYKTTLIMPLVGIGYNYVGFLLAPIFTVFSQLLVIKLDKLIVRENKLEFIFIYTYLGLRLAMSMGLNTQSLFSSILLPTLPLLFIFFLNRKIVFKRRLSDTQLI